MPLLPINLDYSAKDFDALRARLFLLIRSVFTDWTDESIADFGNILVEEFSWVGDVLTYYQDNQARESRIVTAKLRKSLLGLCKLIGYIPKLAGAASVTETFTLNAPVTGGATFTLLKGQKVKTADITNPIAYQLLADLVWAAGEQVKTATVENSEFASNTFSSTGLANQKFQLSAVPFLKIDDCTASNGSYTKVNNLLSSKATDKHFFAVVDQNDRATLVFGNGVNGLIPSGTVTVNYRTGGGKAGRVNQNALTVIDQSNAFKDSLGNPLTVAVNNAAASSAGVDRETNEQIRVNAPASLRVLGRAVSREDYEIAALTVTGVARALHLTSNQLVSVGENQGILFVVPAGGGVPTQQLLDDVAALFLPTGAYPKTNTYQLTVQAPAYLAVNVSARIYIAKGFTGATAKANITAALQALFAVEKSDGTANEAIDFGFNYQDETGAPTGLFPWSDVFNAVRDAAGVVKVDPGNEGVLVNGVRQDITISVAAFPKLGTVTIIDASNGQAL